VSDYLFAPDRLRTDFALIRCYRPGDGPALAEAVNASYEHLRRYMPWARQHRTPRQMEEVARRFRGRWLLAEDFALGVFAPDERRLLGGSGFHLHGRELAGYEAEIGMWIRAEEAGQGLGSQLLGALLAWGFTAWPWRKLIWNCAPDNAASRALAESCGMAWQGVAGQGQQERASYALLREEHPFQVPGRAPYG